MALRSPLSARQLTTAGEHHRTEELQKGCAVAIMIVTFISCLEVQLLWGDVACVASVAVTYVLLLVLFGRRSGWWEPGTHGGISFWLYVLIIVLSLSLGVFLASRLARAAPPSASAALLVAAAAAAVLGVGGLCSYLLHRRSWSSKQERQKMILPLMQESSS